MDTARLQELAETFSLEMGTSEELRSHLANHNQRSQRAQALLTKEHIPRLTEDELRELFFDTDAFGFWSNKEWEFNHRLQKVGLDGLRSVLLELAIRGERGLTPDDLKHLWGMGGLGQVLSCELLAYRFPTRYWPYSAKVTLPAFSLLGMDIKTNMPHGQKSDAYLYTGLEPFMAEVRQALVKAGFTDVDNLSADLFLWWVKNHAEPLPPISPTRYWKTAPGTDAWAWDEFVQRSIIGIGWEGVGDLAERSPQTREELKRLFEPMPEMTAGQRSFAATQLWAFYGQMQVGDLVCVYGKKQILGWGEIAGPYVYQKDDLRYAHRRPVRWTTTIPASVEGLPPALRNRLQTAVTIIPLTKEEFAQIQELARPERHQAWLFQANPRIYDLEEGLRRQRLTDWQVNRYRAEIQPRDRIVYWKAGMNRGIYGLGTVVSDLYQRADGDWVVDVQYDGHLREPVLVDTLRAHPILSNMLIMRQQQGTNFRLTPDEWEALQPLLTEIIPPDADAVDARGKAAPPSPTRPLLAILQGALAGRGLHFTPWQVATFYTALQTKGFVILSGISGTGKTKLAQHFAALLPQPTGETVLPEDRIAITVQPYMPKYGRLIIPKQATRLFDPPAPGESQEIQIRFGDQAQKCRLVHASYGTTDYISLMLRGSARQWFNETFAEGDTVMLDPEWDKADDLTGFRLLAAADLLADAKAREEGKNWLFAPVRPDWRDSKSLLGYYNPLTGSYAWTPFLRFLLRAAASYRDGDGVAWFVILDEMNLAHVEYYFADLLSVLESGRDEDGWTREALQLQHPDDAEGDLPPRELSLPPSLYVVGTVNVDETTHAFSPKVLDRAFTLELTEADFTDYPVSTNSSSEVEAAEREAIARRFTRELTFARIDKSSVAAFIGEHPEMRARLQNLNSLLRNYDLHFGYRVFDEIVSFLQAAEANGLYSDLGGSEAALDAAVLMKVLPKFHGSRGKLEMPLRAVLAWCVDPDAPAMDAIADALDEAEMDTNPAEALLHVSFRYAHTAERIRRMLWALYTSGFAAFG